MRETRDFAPSQLYPRRSNKRVDDTEKTDREYLAEELKYLRNVIGDYAALIEEQSHRVDEYQVQSLGPGTSVTQLLLQPDYEVDEIIESIIVQGPTTVQPPTAQSVQASGNVAAPGALATIVSMSAVTLQSISPGLSLWQVAWSVALEGTLAAADANNMRLSSQGVVIETAEMPAVAGTYPQPAVQWPLAATNAGFIVQSIGAATAGSVYGAEIVATPIFSLPPFTLKLGRRVWSLLLPATGIMVISPVAISLSRSSDRLLTSPVAGDWSLELLGRTDTKYRIK